MEQQNAWNIRKDEILKQLTPAEIARLEAHSGRISKKRGDILFIEDEGERPKVYIVDEGYVRICQISENGKRFIMGVLGPGEFFGAMAPQLDMAETEEILEVVRDTRLIVIDANVFHEVLKGHPEMALRLAQLTELKKRHFQKRLASILFKDVTARTAELLLDLCEKNGEECENAPDQRRDIAVTHQELADMLGAARPVVSGILSRMKKAGLTDKHGACICLTRMEGLRTVAEEGAEALPS